MRSCASLAALLLLCAAAFGESYEWVRSGARYENPVVLSLLLESDLDAAQAVAQGLSKRPDGYVEDIIAGLLDQHSPRAPLLLGGYLAAVTDTAEKAAAWARTNPAAVAALLAALPTLGDGHARVAVLRLLPHAASPGARPVLAAELAGLVGAVRDGGGHSSGATRREIFAALSAAELVGGQELAAAVVEIARQSRDVEAVVEARRVAERLLRDDLPQRSHVEPQGPALADEEAGDHLEVVAGSDVRQKRGGRRHDPEQLRAPLVADQKVEPRP